MIPFYKNITLLIDYLLAFTALSTISGTIIYHVYKLNNAGIFLSLGISLAATSIIIFFNNKSNQANIDIWYASSSTKEKKRDFLHVTLLIIFIILSVWQIKIMLGSQTSTSIISPWEVIAPQFFFLYFLSSAVLLARLQKQSKSNYFLLVTHSFISFSVIAFIYKIGYGFDVFVHNAAIREIVDKGEILPKTWYYIGQYSLVLIAGKLLSLSKTIIGDFLLPIAAAIFLPNAFFKLGRHWFNDATRSSSLVALLLVVPFGIFTNTNPQNLAYLFFLLTILHGLVAKNKYDLFLCYLLAGAALTLQPIAGIPALLITVAVTFFHSELRKSKKYLLALLYLFSVAVLPTLFLLIEQGFTTGQKLIWRLDAVNIRDLIRPLQPHLFNQENFILNIIYFFNYNRIALFFILVIAGFFLVRRSGNIQKKLTIYFFLSASFFLSFLISKFIPFGYLIDYEKSAYPERILLVSALLAMPFVIISLYWVVDKISKQKNTIKAIFLIFIAILMTANFYLSYPRFDNYFNSHGSSISQNDINAVRWIDNDTAGNFVVLANQQLSAASLREFGFKKYYQTASGTIFYYPIPTASPLYQMYLSMVNEKPTRANAEKALALTGADTVYFILNKYWWSFDRLLEEAKLEADSYVNIGLGDIYVFKYTR